MSVREIAETVARAPTRATVEIEHVDNPRVEAEDHYYTPPTPGCSTWASCPTC